MIRTEPLDHDLRMAVGKLQEARKAAMDRIPKAYGQNEAILFAAREAATYDRAIALIEAAIAEDLNTAPCPNCKETVKECACMRNKCHRCGAPVGNITFSVCDECWDKPKKV